MKKLAILRSNYNKPCPLGLPIREACKNVGKSVELMTLVQTPEDVKKNLEIWKNNPQDEKCPYLAAPVNETWVDCSLDPDQPADPIVGSPLYYKWNTGVSLNGGDGGFPLGYYNDNSIDRSQSTMYNLENLAYEVNQFLKKVCSKND